MKIFLIVYMKKYFIKAVVLFLFAVSYFFYSSHISNVDLKNEKLKKINDNKNFSYNLKRDCLKVTEGMDLDELDILILSGNRITNMSNNNGGYKKYWKSINPNEDIPVGDICIVKYDKNNKIYDVKIVVIKRK